MEKIKVVNRFVIARDDERYESFPDVARLEGGDLLVVYRSADQHFPPDPATCRICFRRGSPDGAKWSDPWTLDQRPDDPTVTFWDCPRLTSLADGKVALTANLGAIPGHFGIEAVYLSFSGDGGRSWSPLERLPIQGIIPDRLLVLPDGRRLVSAHYPGIDNRNIQKLIVSDSASGGWSSEVRLAENPALDLCEVSLVHRGDGVLDAYLRENQGVRLPTFVARSEDAGQSWSAVVPHPSRGHRITSGLLQDGRALLTYRNVSGMPATCAWVGDPDARGSVPWGVQLGPATAKLGPEGLRLDTLSGGAVEFGHDPVESLRESQIELEVEVRVREGERGAAVLRGGGCVRILPDRIELETHADLAPFVHAADFREWKRVRLTLDGGSASVSVDGKEVMRGPIGGEATARARIVAFGNLPLDSRTVYRYVENRGRSEWRSVRIRATNPSLPGYAWNWNAAEGRFPDQEERDSVTVLEEETSGEIFEHGYTGWTPLSDGRVFVANYIRGDAPKPYIVGYQLES